MDIRQNILECVDLFVAENKELMSQFKPLKNQDKAKKASSFDYIPEWNHFLPDAENPFKNLLVEQLAQKVSVIIFGEEKDKIKFHLNGHIDYIDGKTWSEVEILEKEKMWETYSYNKVLETLKAEIFQDMIESAFFDNEEDRKFRLYNFSRNQFRHIFESSYCRNCDKNVDIFFNTETRTFESNIYFKECPKISSVLNFKLSLPSKKLVVVNDVRSLFEVNREDENTITINSIHGKKLECEEYLKHNIAYFSLGSGKVDIIKNEDRKLIVLDVSKSNYYKPDVDDDFEKEVNAGFQISGSVYLDLWAVFMLDFDHYKKLCEDKNVSLSKLEPVYVEIKNDELDVTFDMKKLLIEAKF